MNVLFLALASPNSGGQRESADEQTYGRRTKEWRGRIESELGGVGRDIKHYKNKQKGIHEVHVVMSTKTQFCSVSREIYLLGNAIMSRRFVFFLLRSPPQAPPTNMINF